MAKCLVTTLSESVPDTSMLKLGEFEIEVHNNAPSAYEGVYTSTIWVDLADRNEGLDLEIIGDGYFTNNTGTTNFGKTKHIGPQDSLGTPLSRGSYKIRVRSKYNLKKIYCSNTTLTREYTADLSIYKYMHKDLYMASIASLSNAYGDIASLADKDKLEEVAFPDSFIEGDISALGNKPSLRSLRLWTCPKLRGDVSALATSINASTQIVSLSKTGVSGNIAAFSEGTGLTELSLGYSNVSGNLASLANLTSLTKLGVEGTNVVGDTSSLSGLTKLTTFNYANTAITGTWPLT